MAIGTGPFHSNQVKAVKDNSFVAPKEHLREQLLLQCKKRLAVTRNQKEHPGSVLSIQVPITPKDCTVVEKLQMLPPSVHPSHF